MKQRILLAGLLVMMLACWIGNARGQEATTGSIEGTVMEPGGTPLAGATVTTTSAQGERTITTDADGRFRFLYLTPGIYGLTASLHGYTTAERQNIEVRLLARVRVEVILTPGISEQIDVVGAAPVIDLTSSTTGATIGSSLMANIPLGRSFSSTLALAPGVVEGGIDNSNPSIAGSSGLENTYIVDGMSIGNTGYGSAGSYSIVYGSLGTGVNYDYIQEVQVKTGGYEPEYGEAMGGVINLVTKSGGNEFAGSVFTYQQLGALEADRTTTDRVNATYDPVGFSSQDYGFEAGGPIAKDRAFWFAAFDPTFTTRTRKTSAAITEAQGFSHELDAKRTIYNYAANIKWMVNPKHSLSVSAFGDPSVGDEGAQRVEAVSMEEPELKYSKITYGGNNVVGHWNGELLSNWFVEGTVAYHKDVFKEEPAQQLPSGIDYRPTVPIRYGGVGFFEDATSENTQYQLKFSNFLQAGGEHNVRYGLIYQDIGYIETPNYSGPTGIQIRKANGDIATSTSGYTWQIRQDGAYFRINRIRSGELGAETSTDYYAGFLSDTWNPTSWMSIMAGVRNEQEKLSGNVTHYVWKDNWSPRLHVTVDPTKDNKSKVSFAYGRFFGKVPNDLAVRALSQEVSYRIDYDLSMIDLSDPNNPTGMGPEAQLRDPSVLGDSQTLIDKDAKLSYLDEYIVGAEREIMPFFSVGLSYMHRELGRTLEDTADSSYVRQVFDPDAWGEYIIRNPKGPYHPDPSRKYDAVTLMIDKRLHDNWQVLASYTYSELRGNYEGYFRRDNGQSDPFITSAFDFPYLVDPEVWQYTSEDGKLPSDRPHVFNMFGSYRFKNGLNLGLSLKIQSGVPITKLGYNEVYGNGGEIVLEPRGASGRGPTTSNVGLHFDYPIDMKSIGWGGKSLEVSLDIFNLLNQQEGVTFEYEYELGGTVDPPEVLESVLVPCPGCKNPDFGKPVDYMDPRQVVLALRAYF